MAEPKDSKSKFSPEAEAEKARALEELKRREFKDMRPADMVGEAREGAEAAVEAGEAGAMAEIDSGTESVARSSAELSPDEAGRFQQEAAAKAQETRQRVDELGESAAEELAPTYSEREWLLEKELEIEKVITLAEEYFRKPEAPTLNEQQIKLVKYALGDPPTLESLTSLKQELQKTREARAKAGKEAAAEEAPTVPREGPTVPYEGPTYPMEKAAETALPAPEAAAAVAAAELPREAATAEEVPKEARAKAGGEMEKRVDQRMRLEDARNKLDELNERLSKAASRKERKAIEKEIKEATKEYDKERAEFVADKADHQLLEHLREVEGAMKTTCERKGLMKVLGKIPDLIRWMGDQSLLKATGFKPETRKGRVLAAVLKAANLRTATGLVLAGLTFPAAKLGLASAGALVGLRRLFGGTAAGVATFDGLRAYGKFKLESAALSNPRSLNDKELKDSLLAIAARAQLDGKNPLENESYKKLREEYMYRTLATELDNSNRATEDDLKSRLKGQKWKRLRDIAIGGAVGYIVGSGKLAEGLGWVARKLGIIKAEGAAIVGAEKPTGAPEVVPKTIRIPTEAEQFALAQEKARAAAEAAAEAKVGVVGDHVVQKGDNVWNIVKESLRQKYGEAFEALTAKQKSYLIDMVKDRIASDPTKYIDHPTPTIDHIEPDWKVRVGQAIGDVTGEKPEVIDIASRVQAIPKAHEVLGAPRGVPAEYVPKMAMPEGPPVGAQEKPMGLAEQAVPKEFPPEGIMVGGRKVEFLYRAPQYGQIAGLEHGPVKGIDFHGAKVGFGEAKKALLAADYADVVKDRLGHALSGAEKALFEGKISNLELMKRTLGAMQEQGLGGSSEADYLRDNIQSLTGEIKKTYGDILAGTGERAAHAAAAEAAGSKAEAAAAAAQEKARAAGAGAGPRAEAGDMFKEMGKALEGGAKFADARLPFEQRLDALKSILRDNKAIYQGVAFEARGDKLLYRISEGATHEITKNNINTLGEYLKLAGKAGTMPMDEVKERAAVLLKRLE